MNEQEGNPNFPRANEVLRPITRYKIGKRYLGLYFHLNRNRHTCYSLYYDDEINPLQHGMTVNEVFFAIAEELEKV